MARSPFRLSLLRTRRWCNTLEATRERNLEFSSLCRPEVEENRALSFAVAR